MATKNTKKVDIELPATKNKEAAFKSLLAEIQKKQDRFSIGLLTDIQQDTVETISTGSLILDSIIGGGVPKGRLIEIFGPEASGKTSIALTIGANVQKEGGNFFFVDVEQAFDPAYAKKLGVDIDKLGFAQPTIAEDCLSLVLKLCESGTVDIIVVDSIASMVPKAEAEADLEKSTIGLLARLMSRACKQIAQVANQNNCTVIFLNQIRDKVGVMYGPTSDTTGGRAMKFYASQRIEVRRKGKVDDENGKNIGNEVFLRCVKNKIAPPFGEGTTVLTYNQGINKAGEIFTLGEQIGVIQKEGRTYWCTQSGNYNTGLEEYDGRLKIGVNADPVLQQIKNNKPLYDMLSEQTVIKLKQMYGLSSGNVSEDEEEDINE